MNLHSPIPLICLPSFSFPPSSVLVPFSFFVELLYFFIILVIYMTFTFLTFVIISNGSEICFLVSFGFSTHYPSFSLASKTLQLHINRPKQKPVLGHIWKEFGHGSFLPRRLNI